MIKITDILICSILFFLTVILCNQDKGLCLIISQALTHAGRMPFPQFLMFMFLVLVCVLSKPQDMQCVF